MDIMLWQKNKKLFITLGALVLVLLVFSFFYTQNKNLAERNIENEIFSGIRIQNKDFTILVVDTMEELALGLGGRNDLDEAGMLFIFPEVGKHGIWMKDMRFAIDIFWLDENFRIIKVEKNTSPDTFPKTFYPEEPVKYVFETKSGFAENWGLKVGDTLSFF